MKADVVLRAVASAWRVCGAFLGAFADARLLWLKL
jgi:hypothetical protein